MASSDGTHDPFRFCVATNGVTTAGEWRELARGAEGAGYDLLTTTDHIDQDLAPFTALATAAAVTTTLRVGTYVLCHGLRGPVVVAKEFATLDLLSGGRAEVGLGAGWLADDHTRAGVPFGSRPHRFERFAEYVELVSRLLAGGPVTFQGRHFAVSDVTCVPAPARPIPLLIGGSRRRLIELAAARADTVSIAPTRRPDGRRAVYWDHELDAPVRWVRAASNRPGKPEIDIAIHRCEVVSRPGETITRLAGELDLREDQVKAIPSILVGSPAHVTELLLARRERWGASRVTIPATAMDAMAPVVARLSGT